MKQSATLKCRHCLLNTVQMDVSFYLSLERHSWSLSDWDMKPELSSIPSSSCIPKGMPAAQVSKDTPGTHILTKHSSPRTAAGILQCPSIQPDHRFTSSVPGLHTFQTVALLLLFILVLQNPHQNFPSLLFQYPLFSLCTFLLYRPADQTLASAAFSIPPEVRESEATPSQKPKGNRSTKFGRGTDPLLHLCPFRQISI